MRNFPNLFLLFLCFSFLTTTVNSQEGSSYTLFKDVIPPAPTSASLGKYGDIPVGFHSGTPNISIPLYEVKGRALSVPISLSYHASGMRIEETASWVGSGWSLNAGGAVTRTVRGRPDERNVSPYGYIHSNPVPEIPFDPAVQYDYFCNVAVFGLYDAEPDMFNFNINGYSGAFFFSQDGEPHLVPYQNVKIETIDPDTGPFPKYSFTAFKITTPDGIQYFLGQDDENGTSTRETSYSINSCSEDDAEIDATSAWYLNKIVHPNGEEINFTYERNEVEYDMVASESASFTLGTDSPPPGGCTDLPNSICYTNLRSATPKLSGITSEFFTAEFILDTAARQDLSGGVALDKITIKNLAGEVLQDFDLEHDYFEGSLVSGGSYAEYDRYHLMLKAVHSTCQPAHHFEYIGDGSFPSRLSKARDHWGYFNNAQGNHSLMPLMEYGGEEIGSANRRPNALAMQQGTLNKIIYPTGGWTELEYEPHSYGNFNPVYNDVLEQVYVSIADGTGSLVETITPFSITGDPAEGVFEATFDLGASGTPDDILIYAKVEKINTNGSIEQLAYFSPTGSVPIIELDDLAPGDYQLVSGATESGTQAKLHADITEILNLNDPITSKMTGGVRVRKMTDYPASDAPPIVKEFTYDIERDGITHSSGHLNFEPRYLGAITRQIYPILPNPGTTPPTEHSVYNYCEYQTFVSTSNNPLFYQSGSPVGYEKVQVSYPDNGTSTYVYSVAKDRGTASFPYAPFISMNWKKGLLLEKTETGAGGTRTEINNYRFEDDGTYGKAPGLTVKLAWKHPLVGLCGDQNYPNTYHYEYHPYELISPAVFLDSKTVILDGVETTTDYTYSTTTLNPITTEMTNSDGKVYRTETNYAEELQHACLLDQFIHNVPLSSRQYVNGQLTGGMETDFTAEGSMCLPTSFKQVLHDGTILLRGTASYYTDGVRNGLLQDYQQNFFPLTHSYTYYSLGAKAGLMSSRSQGTWTWTYDYTLYNRQLSSTKDLNNIESTYEYDDCQRLTGMTDRNGQLSATFEYAYNLAAGNGYNHIRSFNSGENLTTYQYLDGLGRPLENVNVAYSPTQKDVVMGAAAYDKIGRPYRSYLPYLGTSGGAYAEPNGSFETMLYEASPLGREVGKIFADGSAMGISYGANTSSDEIQNMTSGGMYLAGELYKKSVTDENGHTTVTFTDKVGRLLLTRRFHDGENVDTYNVYDDRGNLKEVLPPGGTNYVYEYDNRNRLESKTVPGAGTTTFGYNDRDEVTITTDANGNTSIFTYDNYGRQLTQTTNGDLVVNNTYDTANGAALGQLASTSVAVLDGSGTMLNSTFAYDDIGRVASSNGTNHLGGSDLITSVYDGGTDRITATNRQHIGFENFTTAESFSFDHSKRMTEVWFQAGAALNTKVADLTYDYKDRMTGKRLGFHIPTGNYLQSVDYQYNIRNWLTGINSLNPYGNNLPIESCEDLPEQIISDCADLVVDLEEILQLRFAEDNINIDCYDECMDYPVPPTDGGGISFRDAINDQITAVINNKQLSEVTYPTQLSRVQFNDGREELMLPDELSLFYGDYTKQECVDVTGENQDIGILSGGKPEIRPFSELIEIRKTTTPTFTSPDNCEDDRCLYQEKYPAHSAVYNNGHSLFPPNGNQWIINEPTNDISNSLEEDNVLWNFNGTAEAEWDLSLDQALPNGAVMTDYTVSLKGLSSTGFKEIYFGLHDGNDFVSINGGQAFLKLTSITQLPTELVLEPDNLPTNSQLETLKFIALIGGTLNMDAVIVSLDYEADCELIPPPVPCTSPIPQCTTAEQQLQNNSLIQIEAAAANMTINDLVLPTLLYRIRLCNGNEIYLFHQELASLQGDYIILHSINISSTEQTFEVDLGLGEGIDQYDLFAMRLYYQEPADDQKNLLQGPIQRNGNIANMQWQTKGREIQNYGFNYDDLDRLNSAKNVEYLENGAVATEDKYGVPDITYDLRGNILSLNRNGLIGACGAPNGPEYSLIDGLSYTYSGNQLQSITDSGSNTKGFTSVGTGNYQYDANGNMTRDPNKGITINYNFLNLPELITFDNGKSIQIIYDAAGNKLRKLTSDGVQTDYLGGIEYKNQTLESIVHSEGRVTTSVKQPGKMIYEYTIKDHLGNSRVMFSDLNEDGKLTIGGEDSEILQESHYYPFGMQMEGNWVPQVGVKNVYLYNGKELNEDFGLDWLDYGNRWYDPSIGRFPSVDRFAEKYSSVTPYHYTLNNPLIYVDVEGDSVELIIGKAYTDGKGVTHKYGHVALRVYNADEGYDNVYDFGRYAGVWGLANHKGDGIFNVHLNSKEYKKYQQSFRNSVGFTASTTPEEDAKIMAYYQSLIDDGTERSTGVPGGGDGKSYKLKDDYNGLDNNCCTLSGDGLKQIDNKAVGSEYDPRDLLKAIEGNYKELGFTRRTEYLKGGGVKVTYQKVSRHRGIGGKKNDEDK